MEIIVRNAIFQPFNERLKTTSRFRLVVTTVVIMMTKAITANLFLNGYLGAYAPTSAKSCRQDAVIYYGKTPQPQ
jgi:hypothetical protein